MKLKSNYASVSLRKMVYFLSFALFLLCQCQSPKKTEIDFMPEFVVTDSLIIDYLGQLNMVDFKEDRSEYLLYDGQRKEFVRIDKEGNLLQSKNLAEDSKDQFGTYYFSINYLPNGQLLFVGFNHFFWYDGELNLIEKKEIPFIIKSLYVNPGHVNLIHEQYLFTHALSKDVGEDSRQKEDFLANHPFLTVYDLEKEKIISQDYIPKSVKMIQAPGKYMDSAPFSLLQDQNLYILFPNSPEIYRFTFPKLILKDTIELNPANSSYAQIKPIDYNNYQRLSSYDMVTENSAYFGLFSSNNFLIAGYYGALPREVVEVYKSKISDEEKKKIREAHKIPYYQVIKDGRKIWEGHLDIQFNYQRKRLFANRNLNHHKVDQELDYIPFYFYEIK